MTRQNRVTPYGEIIAVPERGTLMGNRGCLHDAQGRVTKRSARPAWVTCLLSFNGRQRKVMSPGQYTELFFLDEATALAAGHRPCATCQRDRYNEFRMLWERVHPGQSLIAEVDRTLQRSRYATAGNDALWKADRSQWVDGLFVADARFPYAVALLCNARLHPWTPGGYGAPVAIATTAQATVVTPKPVVDVIRAGFRPRVHSSISDD